jgi:peptide/nickel transport system permease protein
MVVMVNAAVIIEVIFAWPGIGRLLFEGIFQRDFPLVQGVVIMAGFMIVGINLVVDILYAFIDPRIRLAR